MQGLVAVESGLHWMKIQISASYLNDLDGACPLMFSGKMPIRRRGRLPGAFFWSYTKVLVPSGASTNCDTMKTMPSNDERPGPTAQAGDATQAGTPSAFHGVDLAEALRLLGQAGIQISSANETTALQQVIDGLCNLSSRDGLTGLANRRVFNAALGREIDRSARTGEIFGLLLVDVDHFKQVNDRHGHLVGDVVLKAVARLIEDSFRSIDTVARFGGEEFAVILPNVSAAFLHQVAERVRARIENAQIVATRGLRVAVTVSIGTVCSRGHVPQDAKALIEAADRKLYAAKRLGRNRVCGDPAPAAEVTSDERAQLLRIFDSVDTNS